MGSNIVTAPSRVEMEIDHEYAVEFRTTRVTDDFPWAEAIFRAIGCGIAAGTATAVLRMLFR